MLEWDRFEDRIIAIDATFETEVVKMVFAKADWCRGKRERHARTAMQCDLMLQFGGTRRPLGSFW